MSLFSASSPVKRLVGHLQNPLYRNGYALTMSNGLSSALGFVFWMLAARYYPTEVVGTSTATITAIMFLSGLAALYLDGTLARFVPVAGRATPRLVLFVYATLILTGTLVSIVFLMGINLWSPALGFLISSPSLSAAFVLSTVIWCVFNVQDGTIIGMRKSVWVPIENTIYGTLKLALLIVFLYVFPQYGIFLSWIIPILVVIAIVNFFIFRYLIPAHVHATTEIARPITLAQVATYAGGNYAGMIFSLTNTMLPPIMVLQLAGSRASAYFYMPWVMVSFFRSLATDTSLVLVVEGTTDQSRLTQLFRSAIFNTARLVIPAVIGCVIIAPYILRIFGEDYANEGTALFRLLSFAAIPNIVVTLYMGWLRAKNNIGSVTIMQFIIAVLSLPLSYIWLRSYGIMGVGMALLVVQTIIAVVLLLFPLRFMFARPFVAQRAE